MKVNPSGETPVLKHGDDYINDSVKILEYIEKNFAGTKGKLYPKKKEDKIKETIKFVEEEWRPAFSKVLVASAPAIQKVT